MKILLIGDVHSHYNAMTNLVNRLENEVDVVLQVGDLGLYSSLAVATQDIKSYIHSPKLIKSFIHKYQNNTLKVLKKIVYYVKGNHDDFDLIYKNGLEPLGMQIIHNGAVININGVNVLGFGGIYSPVQSYHNGDSLRGRNKRFFTEEQAADAIKNSSGKKIDILLTHNAPVGTIPNRNREEGIDMINEIINAVSPTIVVHGHHHVNYTNGNVIGLGNFSKNKQSYKVVSL